MKTNHDLRFTVCLRAVLLVAALVLASTVDVEAQALKAAGKRVETTAPTNSWAIVTQPTTLYTVTAYNSSATDLYLHVFDATSVPANGTIPTLPPVLIPAGKTGGYDYTIAGCRFANGISVATSTTDRTTTNATASFMINLTHTP